MSKLNPVCGNYTETRTQIALSSRLKYRDSKDYFIGYLGGNIRLMSRHIWCISCRESWVFFVCGLRRSRDARCRDILVNASHYTSGKLMASKYKSSGRRQWKWLFDIRLTSVISCTFVSFVGMPYILRFLRDDRITRATKIRYTTSASVCMSWTKIRQWRNAHYPGYAIFCHSAAGLYFLHKRLIKRSIRLCHY